VVGNLGGIKLKNKISFTGSSLWAFVRQPEKYKGKEVGYSIQVALTEEQIAKIKQFFQERFEEDFGDKKCSGEISLPIKEQKDGTQAIKLRTSLGFTDKMTNEFKNRVIPVLDKYGVPLPPETLVGNGSLVTASGTYKLFYDNATKWGVRIYLDAVKVSELVTYDPYGLTFDEKPDGEEDEKGTVKQTNEADF